MSVGFGGLNAGFFTPNPPLTNSTPGRRGAGYNKNHNNVIYIIIIKLLLFDILIFLHTKKFIYKETMISLYSKISARVRLLLHV